MRFERAILREVPDTYNKCISSHPLHSSLRIEKAREQHKNYEKLLNELGLETIVLEKKNEYPDSCFVEDTAIVHEDTALITRLAKKSRQGEEESVEQVLKDFKKTIRIQPPGTIEGGDVIHLGKQFIIGNTSRTNMDGINQVKEFFGKPVEVIKDLSIVHLKSYVTYLGEGVFVSTEKYSEHPVLQNYDVIVVPKGEEYGANTLAVNDVIIMSEGHEKLLKMVTEHGFDVFTLNMSEFEKCEGALTCLSVRF